MADFRPFSLADVAANAEQVKGLRQSNYLNELRTKEFERKIGEEDSIRQIWAQSGGDPDVAGQALIAAGYGKRGIAARKSRLDIDVTEQGLEEGGLRIDALKLSKEEREAYKRAIQESGGDLKIAAQALRDAGLGKAADAVLQSDQSLRSGEIGITAGSQGIQQNKLQIDEMTRVAGQQQDFDKMMKDLQTGLEVGQGVTDQAGWTRWRETMLDMGREGHAQELSNPTWGPDTKRFLKNWMQRAEEELAASDIPGFRSLNRSYTGANTTGSPQLRRMQELIAMGVPAGIAQATQYPRGVQEVEGYDAVGAPVTILVNALTGQEIGRITEDEAGQTRWVPTGEQTADAPSPSNDPLDLGL